MKKFLGLLLLLMLVLNVSIWAIPFDNTVGPPVVAILDPTPGVGDYATLAAASVGFNGVVGGINRPWTLQVNTGTYTEVANSNFGNTFGVGGSLEIKPASGASPVINFTLLTSGNISGHVVIGVSDLAAPSTTNTFASNGNYVIDGSNTPGGTTRDMQWIVGTPGAAVATLNNHVVTIFGDNDGVIVKNMKIEIYDTAGSHAPIRWGSGNVVGLGDILPDGGLLQNCMLVGSYLGTGAGVNAFGFQAVVASGALTAGVVPGGLVIDKNDIFCKQRGIFLNPYGSITISKNIITLDGITSGGYSSFGIFHMSANSNVGFVQDIYMNVIRINVFPPIAGQIAGGILCNPGGTMDGTYNIRNNTLEYINFTTPYAALTDASNWGISMANVTSDYIVEHNSFNLPNDPNLYGVTAGRLCGIRMPLAMTTGSVTCRNNIVRYPQETTSPATVGVVYSGGNVGLSFIGNNLVPTGGASFGIITGDAGSPYLNLAAWQAGGYDSVASGGQSVDPTTTTPPWDGTLHFASKPVVGQGTVFSSTYLSDIDGDARPPFGAVPGADEPAITPVTDWTLY